MNKYQEYVCGFLFFKEIIGQTPFPEQQVLMVLKDRPVWQAGLYNGIGGKVEPNEKPFDAMVRECWEESGIDTKAWKHYAVMSGPNYKVHFYRAFVDSIPQYEKKTSEEIAHFPASGLPSNLIHSNRYLIPMALEKDLISAEVVTV